MICNRLVLTAVGAVCLACSFSLSSAIHAQSPSVLYTWDGTGNVQDWGKNFGVNSVTLDNHIAGALTILETGTAGSEVAIRDGNNRIRESSGASGGLDLTGLDFLEFDLGHDGTGDVDVQFYVQASTNFTFQALGPDVSVSPGVNTYQLPLSGLSFEEQVYIRTLGFNVRDHAGEGNLQWRLEEVRSGGTPLDVRDLATHDNSSSDNGLQGAVANFDLEAIIGNDGGQNQSGLSHNPSGAGSLQWTDLGDQGTGGPSGGAVSWGNGTAWNGNSFNQRTTDVSNYDFVTYRMKATDVTGGGGMVDVQAFFQRDGFQFQDAGIESLPIDGAYHNLRFPLAGISSLEVTEFSGVNLGAHTNDLLIDVDLVRFSTIPEPSTFLLLGFAAWMFCARTRLNWIER